MDDTLAGTDDRPDCRNCCIQNVQSIPSSIKELPPPHRFRRQSCQDIQKSFVGNILVQEQDLDYLASYRATTGKMLNEEVAGTRRLSQEEVLATARQLSLWHRTG